MRDFAMSSSSVYLKPFMQGTCSCHGERMRNTNQW